MKRLWQIISILLSVLLALSSSAAVASAAPMHKSKGWSSIDIWAFVDNDQNGIYSAGDVGLTDVRVCLTDKKAHQTYCGGTDQGDTWWEPNYGGVFITWVDVNDTEIPAGYKLNSITCTNTGVQSGGKVCRTRFDRAEAQINQVPGALVNVYYAFVPVQ